MNLKRFGLSVLGFIFGFHPDEILGKTPISQMSKKQVFDELYDTIKKTGSYKRAKMLCPDKIQALHDRLEELTEQDNFLFI